MTVRLDFLSGDLDFRWGAQHALLDARICDARRAASGRSLPWNLMAWLFHHPGEMSDPHPWLHKPLLHLLQEVSEVLAQGGAVMLYEKPRRTGYLIGWTHELAAKVADFCRARRRVCFQTRSLPQAAVLHCADCFYLRNQPLYQYQPGTDPIEGALHALLETQRSADVLTEDAAARRLSAYPLLVLPEQSQVPPKLLAAVVARVKAGAKLLLSGANLASEFADLAGVDAAGARLERAACLQVGDEAVAAEGPWQPVAPREGTEVLAWRLRDEEPSGKATGEALITRRRLGRGTVVAAHGPLFAGYFRWPHPRLRALIAGLVEALEVDWLVTVKGPPRLEVVLRRAPGLLLVNLVNRGPACSLLPPKRVLIEELPAVEEIELEVRLARPPAAVRLEPGAQALRWRFRGGRLALRVPRVEVHSVVAIHLRKTRAKRRRAPSDKRN
jgi:hypothetical protein